MYLPSPPQYPVIGCGSKYCTRARHLKDVSRCQAAGGETVTIEDANVRSNFLLTEEIPTAAYIDGWKTAIVVIS